MSVFLENVRSSGYDNSGICKDKIGVDSSKAKIVMCCLFASLPASTLLQVSDFEFLRFKSIFKN